MDDILPMLMEENTKGGWMSIVVLCCVIEETKNRYRCCKFLVKLEAMEEDEESEDGMFLVDLNSEFTMEYDMFVPT